MSKKNIIILSSVVALVVVILAGVLLFNNNAGSKLNVETEADMTNFLTQVYEGIDMYNVESRTLDLNDKEGLKYNTGLTETDKIDKIVISEPMMSAQAYSMILVKVKDPADADSIAKAMFEGVNPRKWICVSAENVNATSSGNVAMLVMSDAEITNNVYNKFVKMAGKIGTEYKKTVEE